MVDEARDYLIQQFETAWKLTTIHLNGLATEECLWRPDADAVREWLTRLQRE